MLYADTTLAPGSGPQPDVESVISLVRGMTTVARFLWPIPDRGISRRLHRVRAPTLVVHGQEDRFVPAAYVNDWLALLPDARGEVIPGAGHMLTVEALEKESTRLHETIADWTDGDGDQRRYNSIVARPSEVNSRIAGHIVA